MTEDAAAGRVPRGIDTTVAHPARIWNYWLGGKDNYRVDREVGEQVRQAFPGIVDVARASRAFLVRAVRYLTVEAGIRQFLDVGTGMPTQNNTHEVAQGLAPESRIVYVDNDPLVLVHATALLTSSPEGACDYIDADVCDPEKILLGASRTLDFTRPIGLMMLGVLGHVADYGEARSIVERLVARLPPGSYLTVNDGSNVSRERAEGTQRYNDTGAVAYNPRTPEEITGYFDGLRLIEPGVVSTSLWRPDPAAVGTPAPVGAFCGVARKD